MSLREITIEVPVVNGATNVAQDEAARAKAEDIRKRLIAGEPFPRLAADFSDSASKANGGLIGPFKRTDLSPALQTLLDGLEPGGVSQPVRSSAGYQIFKLESRTEQKVQAFEAARNEIANRVAQDKQRVQLQQYLDRQRTQAIITWRNDELKQAYEQALAKRQAAASGSTAE